MSFIGFKAQNHPQQTKVRGASDDIDDRRTLPELFEPLHALHRFTIDVASSDENKKLPRHYTMEDDGLAQSWRGEVVWCNPPYSKIGPWVEKAIQETNGGGCTKVVMLLPANRCEQRWWQDFIEPRRERGLGVSVEFLPGRPRFGFPASRPRPVKGDRPPFGCVLVIFEPAQRRIP